jgi:hypothetical protein
MIKTIILISFIVLSLTKLETNILLNPKIINNLLLKKDDFINVTFSYCIPENVIRATEVIQRPKVTTRGTKLNYSIKAGVTRQIKDGNVSMVLLTS